MNFPDNFLEENDQLILAILENQNLGKLNDCLIYQKKLQQNLLYLSSVCQLGPQHQTQGIQMGEQTNAQNFMTFLPIPQSLSEMQSPLNTQTQGNFISQPFKANPQEQNTLLSSPIYVDMNKIVLYTPDAPPKARKDKSS